MDVSNISYYITLQKIGHRDGGYMNFNHYVSQWFLQNGKCLICPTNSPTIVPITLKENKNIAVIDHNHATNIFRGLLCNCCNMFIGKARESKRRLARGIDYLSEYGDYEYEAQPKDIIIADTPINIDHETTELNIFVTFNKMTLSKSFDNDLSPSLTNWYHKMTIPNTIFDPPILPYTPIIIPDPSW